jgi:general secretion pathway protein C
MIMTAKKYFAIINALLVAGGVYFCVKSFYTISTARIHPAAVQKIQPDRVNLSEDNEQPPLSSYGAIARRNLFNTQAGVEIPAKAINVDELKETDLKLKLWGTVSGRGRQAYAVIEDTKTKKQNLYRTGDSIQNATVKMILRQKVVLSVDDRDEVLGMEEIGAASERRESRTIARESSPAPRLPISSYPRQLSLESNQIEAALDNLDQLMDQAEIRPYIEEGRPSGISITAIKPNTVFRKMRLRNGDIITGVNGTPIETVEDAMKIFSDLRSASELQVEIKRRGQKRVLNYKIE